MMSVTEIIPTCSGIRLQVERRTDEERVQIAFRIGRGKRCLLHWGFRRSGISGWQLPPEATWPEGTKSFDHQAAQTAFLQTNGEDQVLITVPLTSAFDALEFVLFFPDERRWDNNGGRNYRVEIHRTERPVAGLAEVLCDPPVDVAT